jgi:hypothetical protein
MRKTVSLAYLAADLRPRRNAMLVRVFVEPDRDLQRIPEWVIEANAIHTLSALRWKAEISFGIGLCGTKDCDTVLGAVSQCHTCDRIPATTMQVSDSI